MTEHPNRQPKGVPTGGQFAASVHAESDVDLGARETPTGTCPSCFAERPHPLAAGKMAYLPGSVCPHCGHIETDMEVESEDGDWLVTLDDEGTIRAIDEHGNTEEVLGVDDPEWDRYADLLDVDRDRVKAALEHAYAEAGEAFAAAVADDEEPLSADQVDQIARPVARGVHRHFKHDDGTFGSYDDFDGGYHRAIAHVDAELLAILGTPSGADETEVARVKDNIIQIARNTPDRDAFLSGFTGHPELSAQDRGRWVTHCLDRAVGAYSEQRGAAEAGVEKYAIGSAAGARYGYANAAAVLIVGGVNNDTTEVSQQIEDAVAAGCADSNQVAEYLHFRSTSSKETADAYDWGG